MVDQITVDANGQSPNLDIVVPLMLTASSAFRIVPVLWNPIEVRDLQRVESENFYICVCV